MIILGEWFVEAGIETSSARVVLCRRIYGAGQKDWAVFRSYESSFHKWLGPRIYSCRSEAVDGYNMVAQKLIESGFAVNFMMLGEDNGEVAAHYDALPGHGAF